MLLVRARALLYLSRFIGREVPAAFLQKTGERCQPAVLAGLRDVQPDEDDLARVEIREQLIRPMELSEPRKAYVCSRDARDRALVESQAAHIIPVREKGRDDPRNGVSLCPRHHRAFDKGLFTVTVGMLVRLSPSVLRAERQKFDSEEYDGESVARPTSDSCVPDPRALEWHQERVFRAA